MQQHTMPMYWKCQFKEDKWIILVLIGLLSAVFVNNFFSELLETDKVGSLFFMALAILVTYDLKTNSINSKN